MATPQSQEPSSAPNNSAVTFTDTGTGVGKGTQAGRGNEDTASRKPSEAARIREVFRYVQYIALVGRGWTS